MNVHQQAPPARLWVVALALGGLFWALAALRHGLLQSNAFDLGLFDQWAWQLSQGLEPVSSQSSKLHLLNDHGAWLFQGIAPFYRLAASVHWLLVLQALSLSFTALPVWILARDAGLSPRLRWIACLLWWLQPVVFNTNLFDFHPETLAMPLLAWLTIAGRRGRPLVWSVLILLVLGLRDGLALITIGMGLEQLLRRRWALALLAIGLSLGWLWLLTTWIQPPLSALHPGVNAGVSRYSELGASLPEIVSNLLHQPWRLLRVIDWGGTIVYLLLISLSLLPFWRRASLPTLMAALPLVIVNIVSDSAAQRDLIHHYNLPLALIAVVAAIDGLASAKASAPPWRRLGWVALCWVILAKPWFFSGPYLSRLSMVADSRVAIAQIRPEDRVATTSYLAPHLSQRQMILFPSDEEKGLEALVREQAINVLLLNRRDPGWASNAEIQEKLLREARQEGWHCQKFDGGLELCRDPRGSRPK